MDKKMRYTAIFFAVYLALTGCAGVPKQPGFDTISQQVDDRIGYRVHWNEDTAADEEVVQAVRDLLGEPLTADAAVQIVAVEQSSPASDLRGIGCRSSRCR